MELNSEINFNDGEYQAEVRTNLHRYAVDRFEYDNNRKWMHNWHFPFLFEALESAFVGKHRFTVINVPPRSGKTEGVTNLLSWGLGNVPSSKWLVTSVTGGLASKIAVTARTYIRGAYHQNLFGTRLKKDEDQKHYFLTEEGGHVYSAGAGGTIVGFGAGEIGDARCGGALVIDDPHKPGDSKSQMLECRTWWEATAESRLNGLYTPVILIMQRLDVNDLTDYFLEHYVVNHLKIPALINEEAVKTFDLDDNKLNKSYWPIRKATKEILKQKERAPETFFAQSQQEPVKKGGNLFNIDTISVITDCPVLQYRKFTIDAANKTASKNDFSVITHFGVDKLGNTCVLNVWRAKVPIDALLDRVLLMWNEALAMNGEQYGHLREIICEDAQNGTALIQLIKSKHRAISIRAVTRKKDKYTRACDVQPYINGGKLMLLQGGYVADLKAEMARFNGDGKDHDDQVDTIIDACFDATQKRRTFEGVT